MCDQTSNTTTESTNYRLIEDAYCASQLYPINRSCQLVLTHLAMAAGEQGGYNPEAVKPIPVTLTYDDLTHRVTTLHLNTVRRCLNRLRILGVITIAKPCTNRPSVITLNTADIIFQGETRRLSRTRAQERADDSNLQFILELAAI